MISEVTMYMANCDGCHRIWIGFEGVVSAMIDQESLQDELELSGWTTDGEKHYCPQCQESFKTAVHGKI